jgi:spermidine synthase
MQTFDMVRRRFLLAVFVVSGFTGLIYESIWSHYLKLFLGHAAYAQTLVLAIFMGGMALGSWAVAHYSSRIRQLLWGYVLVEGLIGVLGIVFHQTVRRRHQFLVCLGDTRASRGIADSCLQMVTGCSTHPSAVRASGHDVSADQRRPDPPLAGERPGETLATLYFTNSLGAAIGVLVSGFVLIQAVGLPGTIRTAGLLNIALALVIWASRARADGACSGAAKPNPRRPGARIAWPDGSRIAAFLTGAASFMYELGWIRMLSLVLGSSTHSFELMLSAFIFGLAFGGLYVRRRIERIQDPVAYVAYVMVAMGTLAALTLPAYNLTFDFMAWFLRTSARTASGYAQFNGISQLIAALIMIPATFCAGMTLPLLTQELMRRGAGERAIGTIYSANTLGAIVGVLLTIHVLMPLIGVKGVILGGAAIHMTLGPVAPLASRHYPSRTAAVARWRRALRYSAAPCSS